MKAEQYFKERYNSHRDDNNCQIVDFSDCIDAMVEFSKMHVEEALKQASEKAELDVTSNYRRCEISESSIINAYPLEDIS